MYSLNWILSDGNISASNSFFHFLKQNVCVFLLKIFDIKFEFKYYVINHVKIIKFARISLKYRSSI